MHFNRYVITQVIYIVSTYRVTVDVLYFVVHSTDSSSVGSIVKRDINRLD